MPVWTAHNCPWCLSAERNNLPEVIVIDGITGSKIKWKCGSELFHYYNKKHKYIWLKTCRKPGWKYEN